MKNSKTIPRSFNAQGRQADRIAIIRVGGTLLWEKFGKVLKVTKAIIKYQVLEGLGLSTELYEPVTGGETVIDSLRRA